LVERVVSSCEGGGGWSKHLKASLEPALLPATNNMLIFIYIFKAMALIS